MRSALLASIAVASVWLAVSEARAVPPNAADAIEQRKRAYGEIGTAYKGIRDLLRRETPTLMMIRRYAKQLQELADAQATQDWFPQGSGPEAGVKTAAKIEIWRDAPEFQKLKLNFREAAARLAKTAEGENLDAMRTSHRALGDACAACHDRFREKDSD